MCRRAEKGFFIQIRNTITEEFCPGLTPGEVKDSTHNPSAVSLLADRGLDTHPHSAVSFSEEVMCSFQACHVVYFSTLVSWLEFLPTMPDRFGVHELLARKVQLHVLVV